MPITKSILPGVPYKLFDAAALATGVSPIVALPGRKVTLAWQIKFGVNPTAFVLGIEASLDGVNFSIINQFDQTNTDSLSLPTGDLVATHIRANLVSLTGGTGPMNVTVLVN